MGLSSVFGEAFLDGFTIAGFPRRLRRPAAPCLLLAPEPQAEAYAKRSAADALIEQHLGVVGLGRPLADISEESLHTAVEVLKQEELRRRTTREYAEKAAHGTA